MDLSENVADVERTLLLGADNDCVHRTVLDMVPFGAVLSSLHPPGDVRYLNPEFTRLTGYQREDIPNTERWLELAYPDRDYRAVVRADLRRFASFEHDERGDQTRRIRCADGSTKDIQFRIVRMADDQVLVMLTDVTDRVAAERAQRETEERYGALLEQLPAGVVVHCGGEIRYANGATLRMVGAERPNQLVGRSLVDFVHPDYRDIVRRRVESIYDKQGHLVPVEERFLRLDGESFPVEVQAVMTDFGGRPASLVVFTDITARKREEEARQSLEEQVRYAQKLESLGILAGGVAHDFNNLLMAMLGNAEMALSELPSGSPIAKRVAAIQSSARRAADLAKQMLDYSGKGRFVISRVDLNEVFLDIADLLDVSVSRKAQLQREFAEDLPPVDGDVSQLRQVMMNLVTNASEALGERRGTIIVRTGTAELSRGELLGAYGADEIEGGRYAFFEVEDDGGGIDPQALPSIFDPFFTTKFTGRGLGLAAVLGIVRAHKGAVQVRSTRGKGSVFRVVLPVAEPVAAEHPPVLLPADGGDWSGEGKVLLVDDDPDVRIVVSVMLRRAGFDVVSAESGPAAIDHYREMGEEIRCVLLDLTMPEVDGYETFVGLREIDDDITVILSSGYNERESVNRFGATPPHAFIQKPYSYEDLVAVLQRTLA